MCSPLFAQATLCPDGASRPVFIKNVPDEAFSKSSHVAARIIQALR